MSSPIYNSATAKTGQNYISLNEPALAPVCLMSFNYSTQFGGGTWSATSRSSLGPLGYLGQTIQFLGMPCVITEIEQGLSNEGPLYYTSGLVGDSRNFNKQILLTMDMSGLAGISQLFPNTPLQSAPSLVWTTIQTAAEAIALNADVPFSWSAPDAPLTDTFIETGMTVGGAIQSLAARVGAKMAFNGSAWEVFTPNSGFGSWGGAPTCPVINQSGGTRVKQILDYENSMITIPVKPLAGGSVTNDPNTPNPPVQLLRGFSQPVQTPTWIKLPGDADLGPNNNSPQMWLQIYVNNSGESENGIYTPGEADPDAPTLPQCTADPNMWFPQVYNLVKIQGLFYAVITNDLFDPSLSSSTGKWVWNVGYTQNTQPVADAISNMVQEQVQRNQLYSQYQQESIRYFVTNRGVQKFWFFGSMPMVGNNATISQGGLSLSGIIESVTVTKASPSTPIECTVQLGKYVLVNQLQPQAILDYYLATGETIP